jgi:hypothetical protein
VLVHDVFLLLHGDVVVLCDIFLYFTLMLTLGFCCLIPFFLPLLLLLPLLVLLLVRFARQPHHCVQARRGYQVRP